MQEVFDFSPFAPTVPKYFFSDTRHQYDKNDVLFIKIRPQEADILIFKDFDFSYNFIEFNFLAELKWTSLVGLVWFYLETII